jgi:replicative DNA helicase
LSQTNTVDNIFICEGIIDLLSIIEVKGAGVSIQSVENTNKFILFLEENLNKIRDKNFILSLDNDKAGEDASKKIIDFFESNKISYSVFGLKGYKDVNEFFIRDKQCFFEAVAGSKKKTLIEDFINYIEKPKKPLKTGFKALDEKLDGGLYAGLYLIGGTSSLGKTTLAHQIAEHAARFEEAKVLYISLEMSIFELIAKSISRIIFLAKQGTVSARKVLNNAVDSETLKKALKLYSESGNLEFFEGLFDTDIDTIKDVCREFAKKYKENKKLIVIDYLQIIPAKAQTDKQKIDIVVSSLKILSRVLDCPLIVISSFGRTNYNTTVGFESFKESGGIEYTADCVIGLQLDVIKDLTDKNINDIRKKINEAREEIPRKIQAVCLKNRHGQGYFTHDFEYNPITNFFEEV